MLVLIASFFLFWLSSSTLDNSIRTTLCSCSFPWLGAFFFSGPVATPFAMLNLILKHNESEVSDDDLEMVKKNKGGKKGQVRVLIFGKVVRVKSVSSQNL